MRSAYFFTICMMCMTAVGINTGLAAEGDPANGKILSQPCVACHAADGNSVNPVWPKLAGQHSAYTVKQLRDFKQGKRVNAQMTTMVSNLTEADMRDIGAYFAGQVVKRGAADPEQIEPGQRIYRYGDSRAGIPACMACHGPDGAGNPGAMYPALGGQHAAYTATQLQMFKTEQRNNDKNNVMRSIAGPMTNAQIEAVSGYIQGLH